jgi:hypothetical protein
MSRSFEAASEVAATQHGAISRRQLTAIGVGLGERRSWVDRRALVRIGPQSYVLPASADTWMRAVWCAQLDLDGRGFVAGRTAARLHQLDGFDRHDRIELLVPRRFRGLDSPWFVCSTSSDLSIASGVIVDGIRCLTAERLILESPLFDFDRIETENAIDGALRLRKVSEPRLRSAAVLTHSRILRDAMVDTGGESSLERRFLALVRLAGLPRPQLQRVFRDGTTVVARVDALFPGGIVVEVEGHTTHSSRQQRESDEKRRNALVRRGLTVTVFTFGHVTREPAYVCAELRAIVAARSQEMCA